MGNPFAYKGAATTGADLIAAMDICSRTRHQNAAALGRNRKPWRAAWRDARWVRLGLATAAESFRVYLGDYSARAEWHAPAGDSAGTPLASPAEYHLHRHMCHEEGMGYDEAWDCPVGLAWASYDAWAEWSGFQKPVTAEDSMLREWQRRVAAGDEAAWAEMQAHYDAQRKAAG
jgi:hypothetical protein